MALKTFVKLNSISNLTEARYGAGMYVNLLGFNLNDPSGKIIDPELFKEITGWVSGVEFVGEFTFNSKPNLLEILKDYPAITWIEYDQIEELKSLVGKGYSLIFKADLGGILHLEPEVAQILSKQGIILHLTSKNDQLSQDQLAAVKKLATNCKVILGSGINSNNVMDLVETCEIFGISLSGGEETKPGLKDLDQLADILEILETEE
ncbi:phosphoribosylanthranilate isomerase [Algoriphagus sp. A40]|uniref:phosphoribosylanthranilate isomerase n=1 Tax=Algoriphagus sp. A40 TaxID=1945863 RepID=UPI000985B7C2|nr:phosphoribosylanthranilate isomerase [Algoriphagus sp. A40]OOG72434.1 phosphoribosylanthranilate isomerase [Algoriphagus sp. A40]